MEAPPLVARAVVRLGIVGGGQLGRMLALSAHSLGVRVTCLEAGGSASPAGQVADTIDGALSNVEALRELASRSDVLTVEIEHVDVDALESVAAAANIPVHPSPGTLRLIQDKYAQKCFFRDSEVPLGQFIDIPSEAALQSAIEDFGLPLMLKSKRLAYDGRGNFVVRTLADASQGWTALGGASGGGLFAERWVEFVRELAVIVARGRDGAISSYPVVHTVQRDSICHVVLAPAQGVSQTVLAEAARVASKAVGRLTGAGIFGVELFELNDGKVLLNEIAPRVHNSGHFTTEACNVSQFEQHVRAVCGLPLGSTEMRVPAASMINVLGTGDGPSAEASTWRLCNAALNATGASVHWYGKGGSMKRGRKVGHVTITGESGVVVLERTRSLLRLGAGDVSAEDADIALRGVSAAPIVGVIMGSDSDLPAMMPCAALLREFEIPFEITIVSAHRTPDRLVEYSRSARSRGLRVIIAAAGGAAHLPGMVAALTPLPVIGVPIPLKHLDGVDSLHSILQMPKGVPVATVAIGNSANGALLAARILGAAQPRLLDAMEAYQERMRDEVLAKAERLERIGADAYLTAHR